MLKTLAKRIALAERATASRSKYSEECICFPAKELPYFPSDEEQEAAHLVKCPIHRDRFQKLYYLYRAPWHEERMAMAWKSRTEQYKKAWLAGGSSRPT